MNEQAQVLTLMGVSVSGASEGQRLKWDYWELNFDRKPAACHVDCSL